MNLQDLQIASTLQVQITKTNRNIATMVQVRNLKRVEGMEIYRKFESYSPLYNLHTYLLFILPVLIDFFHLDFIAIINY